METANVFWMTASSFVHCSRLAKLKCFLLLSFLLVFFCCCFVCLFVCVCGFFFFFWGGGGGGLPQTRSRVTQYTLPCHLGIIFGMCIYMYMYRHCVRLEEFECERRIKRSTAHEGPLTAYLNLQAGNLFQYHSIPFIFSFQNIRDIAYWHYHRC